MISLYLGSKRDELVLLYFYVFPVTGLILHVIFPVLIIAVTFGVFWKTKVGRIQISSELYLF